MFHQFTNAQLIVAASVLVVVAIVVAERFRRRKAKTAVLRNRFGTEYDRAVEVHGSLKTAEANLNSREYRVHALKTHELGDAERERFSAQWQSVQSRFLDHPEAAVTEADDLITALLEARGYPKAIFEQRAADVSVTYPHLMENYRLAHAIAVRNSPILATTEELRTSMIQYRAIFDELILAQKARIEASAA